MKFLTQLYFRAKYFGQAFLAASGATINYWNGSSWVGKPLKYWDGSAWSSGTLKRWDGGAWV